MVSVAPSHSPTQVYCQNCCETAVNSTSLYMHRLSTDLVYTQMWCLVHVLLTTLSQLPVQAGAKQVML